VKTQLDADRVSVFHARRGGKLSDLDNERPCTRARTRSKKDTLTDSLAKLVTVQGMRAVEPCCTSWLVAFKGPKPGEDDDEEEDDDDD